MTTTHYDETPTENSSALPPGTYRARAITWSYDTTKDGDLCIALMFELLDGRPGYQIDGRLYLDESKPDAKGRTALSRSMEALTAMGLEGGALTPDLAGIDRGEVEIVTDINDKGYARIKWINAPRAPRDLRTFAPPEAPQLNNLLARINAGLRSAGMAARASGTANGTAQTARQPVQQAAQSSRTAQTQARVAQPSQRLPHHPQAHQMGQGYNPNQSPQRGNQPPPKVHGQTAGEFGGDDDIPF